MTRVLVLGGTRHVGRAAVEHALGRDWDVTVVNRGTGRPEPSGVGVVRVDRTVDGALRRALDGLGDWDVVLDTWSGAPRVVQDSAAALADRTDAYAYISSVSVYEWPWSRQGDESAAVVAADPSSAGTDYAADKRGAEIAVLEAFGEQGCFIARAGLILGPYEVVGRLPWWLQQLSASDAVLVPGPPDRALQLIDGRDLAGWVLDASLGGARGAVNSVGPAGITTMGELVGAAAQVTGSTARLEWISPEDVLLAGLEPWTQLPIWAPPEGEMAAIHDVGIRRAAALGLTCRPVEQTVSDTWQWILSEGYPDSVLEGRVGMDPAARRAARMALGLQP